ncbi:exodeoxyribonuclease 7 large subunit [Lentibacillus populi]|uniref:Exodeoxyribonuclease 7 large subunit n=1 Tax=Lentibacillus populi TaxID=1827502 RepID=A0A9W5X4T2_9BACI|nr:exodeoxyribonuclease VII large subunit [Lentibacillus populi]GGB34654.1 exodeoxyribonuclease 7 large subunit [Lentibacillus populi]
MNDKYLTVTALTKYIKRKFDSDPHLKNIWLKGEISNFKHHSRGHMYLTIKDEQTRIQAVMFAGNNRRLKFQPENGMNVLIKGEIGVFEPHGQYQLYIQQMEPDGIGALYLAFEQLKEKLNKQGYFDQSVKKQLPMYPKHIGVITSPTGAAVRDIITTIKRRYPIVATTVIPVLVQGRNAAASIKRAIELANEKAMFDLLIVGRGGGSIEELWSFNEEAVAHAIFHSKIPIISAVGHETDITISDYIADLRAPTPTGAAEMAVPSQTELQEKIIGLKRSLTRAMKQKAHTSEQQLNQMQEAYAFRYPKQLVVQKEQELDKQVERLSKAFRQVLTTKRGSLQNIEQRLVTQHPKSQVAQMKKELKQLEKQHTFLMKQIVEKKSAQFTNIIEKLTLLNPLETMKRGYAIPFAHNGEIIHSAGKVEINDKITVKLADGSLACNVLEVEEDNNGKA